MKFHRVNVETSSCCAGRSRILKFSLIGLLTLLLSATQILAEILTAHIIPHSHCDPGWLNTFENYYLAEVHLILDGVTQALLRDPERRFIWAETSFFNRWYEVQSAETKKSFKKLVESGQLEFVGGGWSQHDEANPDTFAIVNQLTVGHEYLLRNFGVTPRVAWQIDPFGHSSVSPSLFSLAGYEALVINRIHHRLKDSFKRHKQMEFFWRGADVGGNTDLLTHVLHTHYSAPNGFDWEEAAPPVTADTVAYRAQELVNQLKTRAIAYRSHHLLVPFGDDFKFKQADRQFSSMDQLITYINAHSDSLGMRIRYSTPSEYFSAIQNQAAFPIFQGDFYPYADNDDSYWTGYYTTRPMLKSKSRTLASLLRDAEIIHALTRGGPDSETDSNAQLLSPQYWETHFQHIERARFETSLFLHHDAITGTSRSNVVQDYLNRMDTASDKLLLVLSGMLERVMTKEPNPSPQFQPGPVAIAPTDISYHPVVIYNSLAWNRKELVQLKVNSRFARVVDSDGVSIPCQIDSYFSDFTAAAIPSTSQFLLTFVASLPPVSAVTFFVHVSPSAQSDDKDKFDLSSTTQSITTIYRPGAFFGLGRRGGDEIKSKYIEYATSGIGTTVVIENELMSVSINYKTGLVQQIVDKQTGTNIAIDHVYAKYSTGRGGAYLFRPLGPKQVISVMDSPTIRVTRGSIVNTVQVRHSSFDIEFSLASGSDMDLCGHVSVVQNVATEGNSELVSVFRTNIPNQGVFYTHSGLGFLKRTRREAPNDVFEADKKWAAGIASNFYPMIAGGRLESANNERFTLLTSHSMACGSTGDGEIEMLIHRHLLQDDGRGLAEAVQDNSRVDVQFWLMADSNRPDVDFRRRWIRLNNPLRIFHKRESGTARDSPSVWKQTQHVSWQPLSGPLPNHVHLFHLQVRDSITDDIAIRLQGLSSDAQPFSTSLSQIFSKQWYTTSEVRRTSLSLVRTLPFSSSPTRSLSFSYSTDEQEQAYEAQAKKEFEEARQQGRIWDDNRQNTDEQGVFISNAALERMKAEREKKLNAGNRRLLAWTHNNAENDHHEFVDRHAHDRSLLAVGMSLSSSSSSPSFSILPNQLVSYVFHLHPVTLHIANAASSSNSDSVSQAHEPQGREEVEQEASREDEKKLESSTSSKNASDDISLSPPRSHRLQPPDSQHGRGKLNFNDDHTTFPAHAHTIIPSRAEYIFVLIASMAVLTLFLGGLGVLNWRATPSEPLSASTKYDRKSDRSGGAPATAAGSGDRSTNRRREGERED